MTSSKNNSSSDSIAKIFNRYRYNMKRIAFNILKDDQYSEDAVSESMIKIIKNIKMINDIESKKCANFIYTITKNTAFDIYRKRKREFDNCITTDNLESFNNTSYVIDYNIGEVKHNFGDLIEKYLKNLESIELDIISLKYGDEFTYKEIGLILEMSEAAVRQRTLRIRHKLEKMILEEK